MKPRRAFYRQGKEYESTLNQHRVQAGLTHKELARQARVCQTSVSALANGMMSPVKHYTGLLKPGVDRICKVLGVDAGDLFPRYICKIDASFLTDDQTADICHAEQVDVEEAVEQLEVFAWLARAWKELNPRGRGILAGMLAGETYEALAERYGISKSRTAQIAKQTMRSFRSHLHKTREYREMKQNWRG